MIPFLNAVDAFRYIFSRLPLPVVSFFLTFVCLELGIHFIKWVVDSLLS